ncbi:DUF6470 family protein [Acetivibrio clariflavus]|uniref:Uncharacterized protein n=1 Tax=Acetivibrio clariflavus (strain DSM 19732 / NBRC 101661 / EBR45) TaxID=720554 RepID=G8LTM1_ACECE|nr:DUF6470 family protein [Acetivibrio clariflavus]AEV70531.1 hypothetical protein Clocl_4097 [Acetivibrio clariflavus DSM 19732]
MALYITQTHARIGIEKIPSKLELKAEPARLEFRQKHALIKIDTEMPKVIIDQSEAFASAGLKSNMDIVKEGAQKGRQKCLEYIGKTVVDGDTLAAIENNINAIAEISKRDFYKTHEFNIDCIPKVGPKITVIEGDVDFEMEKDTDGLVNGLESRFFPADLKINFTPAQVRVFLEQYASIQFKYINENKINTYV